MSSLSKRILLPLCFVSQTQALAATPESDLELELRNKQNTVSNTMNYSLSEVIPALEFLQNLPKPMPCAEVSIEENSPNLKTTFDAQGKPCKMYDLAFPTLSALKSVRIGKIPVQRFTSKDFLAWIRGDVETEQSIESFTERFQESQLPSTWYGQLQFKVESSTPSLNFNLSEIDLGTSLEYSREELAGLRKLAALARPNDAAFEEFLTSPNTLLSSISLRWNETEKVFDIFSNLQILPVNGPIAHVDFQMQYKFIVEQLARSAALKAFKYAISFVQNPTAKKVLTVAIDDVFESLELEYGYQMNRVEALLEANLRGEIPTTIPQADIARTLNILAAQRSNLAVQYILKRAQGGTIDLNNLDRMGAEVRHQNAKTRESTRLRLHSDLVIKKECSTEIYRDLFAICTNPSGKRELYSLLSEQNVLGWKLGAQNLHSYTQRNRTMAIRNTAWLLSAAVRISPLPIPASLNREIVKIAKSFSSAGILDEGTLMGTLQADLNDGPQQEFAKDILPWLHKQSIVLFAPKTAEIETRIVSAHDQRLKARIGQ
jgi:hypothetical protein